MKAKLKIICLLLLLVAGLLSSYGEAEPFIYFSGQEQEKLDKIANAEPSQTLSAFGNSITLDICYDVLSSLTNRLQFRDLVLKAAQNCGAFADKLLETSPSNGYAPIISAYRYGLNNNINSVLLHLENSRAASPSTMWLASLRLKQLRELQNSTVDFSPYRPDLDIITLGMTAKGRSWLSDWFKGDSKFRQLLKSAALRLPPAEQAAFLRSLQR